jgi:hypothetical protein
VQCGGVPGGQRDNHVPQRVVYPDAQYADVYPTAPPDEAEAARRARLSREQSTRG